MALFTIHNGSAKKIPPFKAELEKDVQKIFEKNLSEILNITFLASEYTTGWGGRIDTLGIDNNGSPAIIEYKRNQNESVINQGLSYLRWLLDHKADFEALVHQLGSDAKIDWTSPRVICIAENYNKFDLDTADLLPINIELLRYQIYRDNILLVEPQTQQKVRISASKVFTKKEKRETFIKANVKHTIADHLAGVAPLTKKIFEILNEKITALDESIIVEPKAKYIAYKLTTNFVDVVVLKNGLKIFLNVPSDELVDPYELARDLTKPKKIGHWGNGDYEVKVNKDENLDQIFFLIKQSYTYNK